MPTKTLQAFDIRQEWPAAWGASGILVVALESDIVSDEGAHYPACSGLGGPLDSLGVRWEAAVTVAGELARAGSVSGLPTTDSARPANKARYHVHLYDSRGHLRARLNPKALHLLSSLPGSFTWEQWVVSNQFTPTYNPQFIADRVTVQAMIDAALRSFASVNGRATLVNGAAVVLTTEVTEFSNIQLTAQDSGVLGALYVSRRVANEYFEITSTGNLDAGVVGWSIQPSSGGVGLFEPGGSGRVALVGGVAVIPTSLVTNDSNILLTGQDGAVTGTLYVASRTPGVSFTIASTVMLDSGVVAWGIMEPS